MLIVIVIAKFRVTQILALVLLVSPLLGVLDPASMHDCDRKGCHSCVIGLVVQFLMLPFGIGTLLYVLADRFVLKRA